MIDKNIIYVLTILESIEKIKIYTSEFENADDFYNSKDQLQFNAVLKLLSVIGEESNKIENYLLKDNSVNWRNIKDMRNRIVHDYRGVDPFIVYSIVNENLEELKTELIKIFNQLKIELSNELLNEIIPSSYYRHLSYLLR